MKTDISFEAHDKSLAEVLFSHRKFRVPRYQRPYAWTVDQVSELWGDLIASEEPYFLGSFIFNTEHEKGEDYVDIIDGQQRLLTITILAAVLRDVAQGVDPEASKLYQRQDIAVEDRSGKESFRIRPADTLEQYFKKQIQCTGSDITASTPETVEQKRVRENYIYLHQQVSSEVAASASKDKQLSILNRLRQKVAALIVISVEIAREEDAYEIFETTNARGLELSVGDLLKNLIFKKIR